MTIIKANDSFRLSLSKRKCLAPEDCFQIEMIQEYMTDDKVDSVSTYQFFLTSEELKALSENLVK